MEQSPPTDRRTVNLRQAAKELGISVPVIYRLAHRDELPVPVTRLGNRMVLSRAALDDVLDQRKEAAAA